MTSDPNEDIPKFRGVTFPTGGQFRILELSISETDGVRIGGYEVRSELWPQWVRIADQEVDASTAAHRGNPGPDGGAAFGAALEDELRHAMAAISATAFALEAFTASVIDAEPCVRPPRPADGTRTAAHSFIAETWKRAFRMDPKHLPAVRADLKQIFDLRNMAVHMTSGFAPPALHPDFNVAIDNKFLWFRQVNAAAAVAITGKLLADLAIAPRPRYPAVIAWSENQTNLLRLLGRIPADDKGAQKTEI